jgi:GNAT superfamily N-acetyltransferase
MPPSQGTAKNETMVAAEVFAEGFGYARNFTHPAILKRIGPLWVLHDAPRKNPLEYRRAEWVAGGVSPAEVNRIVRGHALGRYCICVFVASNTPMDQVKLEYRALGFRLGASEPLMAHELSRIPKRMSPATIKRVTTSEEMESLFMAAGRRQLLEEHLKPTSPLRVYVAMVDGKIAGWSRSVTCTKGNYCSNMYVLPPFRRRGIASALLTTMLREDRRLGAKRAVLTSSKAGAKLYASVGYEEAGTFLLYTPRR